MLSINFTPRMVIIIISYRNMIMTKTDNYWKYNASSNNFKFHIIKLINVFSRYFTAIANHKFKSNNNYSATLQHCHKGFAITWTTIKCQTSFGLIATSQCYHNITCHMISLFSNIFLIIHIFFRYFQIFAIFSSVLVIFGPRYAKSK